MNFLKHPNIPQQAVKYVVCDSRIDKSIIKELKTLNVDTLLVPENKNLQTPVSAHADMQLFHAGEGTFYTSDNYCEFFTKQIKEIGIDCEFFNNIMISNKLSEEYPYDVPLNGATVGEYLICNSKTLSKEILENTDRIIVTVKQGYAKCSICVVSDSAIITDDASIANAVRGKLDVLYVDHSQVQVMLKGYSYGFIGGCSGKLSKDVLAFTGNIESSDHYSKIKSFCRNHNVYCISLSNSCLYDYGSILPIIED